MALKDEILAELMEADERRLTSMQLVQRLDVPTEGDDTQTAVVERALCELRDEGRVMGMHVAPDWYGWAAIVEPEVEEAAA